MEKGHIFHQETQPPGGKNPAEETLTLHLGCRKNNPHRSSVAPLACADHDPDRGELHETIADLQKQQNLRQTPGDLRRHPRLLTSAFTSNAWSTSRRTPRSHFQLIKPFSVDTTMREPKISKSDVTKVKTNRSQKEAKNNSQINKSTNQVNFEVPRQNPSAPWRPKTELQRGTHRHFSR
jgi:hypothetical protein